MRLAWDAIRPGGMVVVVGLAPAGVEVSLPAIEFLSDKGIRGSYYGSGDPAADLPALAALALDGRIDLAGSSRTSPCSTASTRRSTDCGAVPGHDRSSSSTRRPPGSAHSPHDAALPGAAASAGTQATRLIASAPASWQSRQRASYESRRRRRSSRPSTGRARRRRGAGSSSRCRRSGGRRPAACRRTRPGRAAPA